MQILKIARGVMVGLVLSPLALLGQYGASVSTQQQQQLANAVPRTFPNGIPVTGRGDSIFAGYLTTTPSTDNPLAQLGVLTGWNINNIAVSGDTDVDAMQRVNWNQPITKASVTVSNLGVNTQAVICNSDNCAPGTPPINADIVLFKRMKEAWWLYDSTPDTQKIKATAMTQSGTWFALNTASGLSAYPSWALASTTNNSTLTFSVFGTRVDVITGIQARNGGSLATGGYTISVDGNPVTDAATNTTTFAGQTIDTLGQNNGVWGMTDIGISGLTNTLHTVVFTNTFVSGTASVVYWGQGEAPGTPSYAGGTVIQVLPERAASSCTKYPSHQDAVTDYFRSYTLQAAADLNSTAGTQVITTDITGGDGYDPNNSGDMGDCLHPSTQGATKAANHLYGIAQAVQAGIQGSLPLPTVTPAAPSTPAPANTVSYLECATTSACSPTINTGLVYVDANASGTVNLPSIPASTTPNGTANYIRITCLLSGGCTVTVPSNYGLLPSSAVTNGTFTVGNGKTELFESYNANAANWIEAVP